MNNTHAKTSSNRIVTIGSGKKDIVTTKMNLRMFTRFKYVLMFLFFISFHQIGWCDKKEPTLYLNTPTQPKNLPAKFSLGPIFGVEYVVLGGGCRWWWSKVSNWKSNECHRFIGSL